jgi:hypothetical protein
VIVTSANGLADGSDLNVGALTAIAFAAPLNGLGLDSNQTTTGDTSETSSGTTTVTDNGLNRMQEVIGAGNAVFSALMSVRYPR